MFLVSASPPIATLLPALFAFSAVTPMAILLFPSIFCVRVLVPIAMLFCPIVFLIRALVPIATAPLPEMFFRRALAPTAILFEPVFALRLPFPIPILLLPARSEVHPWLYDFLFPHI